MKAILLVKEGLWNDGRSCRPQEALIHAIFSIQADKAMRVYGLGLFTQKGSSRKSQGGQVSIFYWCNLPTPDKIIDQSDVRGLVGGSATSG
jgi:hypothetical protein